MAKAPILTKLFFCLIAIHYTHGQDSHFCDMKKKTKAECPEQLDILFEYSKDDSEWKIDFEEFRLQKIFHTSDLIQEINNRRSSGELCPYTKIQRQCCEGYSGENCEIGTFKFKNKNSPLYYLLFTKLIYLDLFHCKI